MTNQEKVKIHSSNLELITKRQELLKAQKEIIIKDMIDALCNDANSIKALQESITEF